MAALDPSISEPNPTSEMAGRADTYRIAARLIKDAGYGLDAEPSDVLRLAEFLHFGQEG